MAQTGSAQREPSMEEILASIRRIIEDSDTARRPLDEAGAPELAPPAPAGEAQHEVEAFRAEFDEAEASQAAIHADQPAQEPVQAPPQPQPQEMAHPAPRPQIEVLPFGGPVPAHDDEPAAPPAFAEHDDEPAPEPAPESLDVAAAHPAPAEVRPSLLSDHAGRQVAAAFGELSEAFAASRRRSFDEMAEEMLRPMLQDWLDNNLPTLVERLVREEIERVARGG